MMNVDDDYDPGCRRAAFIGIALFVIVFWLSMCWLALVVVR